MSYFEEKIMKRIEIRQLFAEPEKFEGESVRVCGWIKSLRDGKSVAFAQITDGSCFTPVQIVFESEKISDYKRITSLNTGAAIEVTGNFILTEGAQQPFEINAADVQVLGESSSEYPLQKKRHTLEYMRTIAHLRPRANIYNAVFRVRSCAAYALHKFFQENGFVYAHTPLISASDCEGAGEMFKVTTLDLENVPKTDDGAVDYTTDFFGKATGLTVSGQLEGECMALAFGKIYTFGPTFRAEKSYTGRHAAEFWMIEPEMAFADLQEDMETAEKMLKYVLGYILDNCKQDMEFLNKFVDKGLLQRLEGIVNSKFERVTYTQAVEILEKHNDEFEYKVSWGTDLQTEHERYLTERVFEGPVFVTDYPKDIKAFYMRLNDDGKTVAAVDLLVPGVGEIIGGSQREEREEILRGRMKELGLNEEDYWWYLELRKFGGVKHAGFGLGFERLIMYVTGVQNIRDVIPFPRTTGSAEF